VGTTEKAELADMEISPQAMKSNSRQQSLGNEGRSRFSVVPRALFAQDGVKLHCSKKSDLLKILEALPQRQTTAPDNDREQAIYPDNDWEQATVPDNNIGHATALDNDRGQATATDDDYDLYSMY
jgi:hypothetical protein